MLKKRVILSLATLLLLAAGGDAGRYRVESEPSQLVFSVPYLHGVLGEAVGEFEDLAGEVVYDADDPTASDVVVRVRTSSVKTQFESRDVDLRGDGFFASERYPEAVFRSRTIESSSRGFVAHGELELRGHLRPVSIRFDVRKLTEDEGQRLWVTGSTRLARSDFGIDGPNLVGEFAIGEFVSLRFNLLLVPVAG